MCNGRGGFLILWIWFSNCTAFYVGCKPHIVLILSGVIWCRYVALYAYGVFSFTYVMNFIVIIDLTCCCFLQYGALALFGWAGVAGTVTWAVDIVEGFMLSIFELLTGLRYAHFWCAVIQYFPHPAVMFFHLIFCPHHFSTQTDAPGGDALVRSTKKIVPCLQSSVVGVASWSGTAWLLLVLGSCGSLRETWIPTCTVTFWSRRWCPPFRKGFSTLPPQTHHQDDNCLAA